MWVFVFFFSPVETLNQFYWKVDTYCQGKKDAPGWHRVCKKIRNSLWNVFLEIYDLTDAFLLPKEHSYCICVRVLLCGEIWKADVWSTCIAESSPVQVNWPEQIHTPSPTCLSSCLSGFWMQASFQSPCTFACSNLPWTTLFKKLSFWKGNVMGKKIAIFRKFSKKE